MSNKPDGGPAFHFLEMDHSGAPYHQNPGMSLRDYFAAEALPSIVVVVSAGQHQPPPTYAHGSDRARWIADESYRLADAMLKARES